jgi:hypothetical protein
VINLFISFWFKSSALTLISKYYVPGPYFVLKLEVLKVTTDKLAGTALREKMGKTESNIPTWVKRFENLVSEERLDKLQSDVIPGFVQSKMVTEMPKMMGKRLSGKGMVADVNVVEEKDQDQFFKIQLKEARKLMGKDPEL